MATPIYKGAVQPAANSGWLSGMGSWFGASAPAYAVPAPKPVAAVTTPTPIGGAGARRRACDPDRITLVIPRELIGSQQPIVSASRDGDVSSDDAERITLCDSALADQSQQ